MPIPTFPAAVIRNFSEVLVLKAMSLLSTRITLAVSEAEPASAIAMPAPPSVDTALINTSSELSICKEVSGLFVPIPTSPEIWTLPPPTIVNFSTSLFGHSVT